MRFAHCDPAGMVFYPRYLEMFNNLVEDWCRAEQIPFAEFQSGRAWGLPTVHLDVDFTAPSFMGEVLSATLEVRSLGASWLSSEASGVLPGTGAPAFGEFVCVVGPRSPVQ